VSARPRVGISRCLLGDLVRYDGTHKRDEGLLEAFNDTVEWVPVCPEVEVGMGTPREPIQLVAHPYGVRSGIERVLLVGLTSGENWTDRMRTWARDCVEALRALELSGFILKARSPSCGVRGVTIESALTTGRGLFAQALVEAMPELPMEDEEGLSDPGARAAFLDRVRAFRRP
jgi:uncharacterized protein YbbK (DUF523 family)